MQLAHRIRIAITVFGLYLTLLSTTAAFENTGDESASDKADSQAAIVLKDATIHSMGAKGSYVGSILVKSGKIEAIGESVEVPDDAKVYDLKGFHLTPGLIESRGKLWLTPTAISESNSKAELKVVDAIDPWNEDWKELAAQGVTSVYVQPNSTSSVGGLGAVLRVGPHGSVDDIVMKDEVAVQVSIGTKGKSSKDRYAQIQALEKLLKSAQDKDKKKDDAKDKDKKDKDDKNKDNKDNKNKDNKDKDKKDQNNKDKKDDKKDEGDNKDKSKESDKNKDQKEQQKPKPQQGKMSPEQIKQLLESLNNEEKKTQKKMNVRKAKGKKVKQEKDW